jgi:hypothetical protein
LWKTFNTAAQLRFHVLNKVELNMKRDHGALLKVNHSPVGYGHSELIQQRLHPASSKLPSSEDNEDVVCIYTEGKEQSRTTGAAGLDLAESGVGEDHI